MRHFDQITSLNLETYLEDKEVKVIKTEHLLQFLEREIKRTENARREQFSVERRNGFRAPYQAPFKAQERNNLPEKKNVFNLAQRRLSVPYKCSVETVVS